MPKFIPFLKTFIVLLFATGALFAQPTLVTVTGPINNPNGTPWSGHITVSNPGVICGGVKIQASAQDYTVTNGVSIPVIQLYALASCTPGYDYNVIYYGKGRAPAFWAIPSSPAITTVAAIERNTQIPASMQLNWNQMPAGTAVGQVPTWGGASWVLAIPASAAASVSSVFGRSGAVAAQAGDYTTDLVTEGGNQYFTPARVQTAMAGLYQTPLTWLGSAISGALDQILGSAAQKPASYFQAAISGAPTTWPSFANVATSGNYSDLSNTPAIPAAQVQSDWNASSGLSAILNKPTIPSTTAQITESGNLYFTAARAQSAMAGLYQAPITGAPSTWPSTWPWASLSGVPSFATVATSGSYVDLTNKPTIPAAQVQSDWNASSGLGAILNKPTIPSSTAQIAESGNLYFTPARVLSAMAGLYQAPITGAPGTWPSFAAVATSGNFNDLSNKPSIPAAQVNSDWSSVSGLSQILNKPTTWPWASLSGVPSLVNSLNGQSGAISLGIGTAGTAPGWSTSTLNIPLASATSVTAGLLSNFDYLSFAAKQAAISGAPGAWPTTWPWAAVSGIPSTFAPSAHAASHQYGGTDLVGTATPAANAIPMAGSAGTLAPGWIPALSYAPQTSGSAVLKGNGSGGTTAAGYADIFSLFTGCSGTMYPGYDGACHSASGSMTWPSGTGIPQVSGGASWGTTLSTTGGGSYIPTVTSTSTFSTTASAVYTFPGSTQTLAGIGQANTWTGLQYLSGGLKIASSATTSNQFVSAGAYTGSNDGAFNRANTASHGFGASSTPSVIEIYDVNGGAGTGAKNGVLPAHFTTGASGASAAVSATNLFTAPGSAVQQVWIITGTITPTSTWSCGSGTGTLAMTIAWTDARGANSYSPISVAATSVSNAVASGTAMNGSYTFQTTIIQKSTTPATYAIAVPSGCTTVSFDYFVSAARIG